MNISESPASSAAFSVIIPAHNGERFIAEAITSVLHQTYPHFRLFILESGSMDRTLEIVHSFDDSRVKLVTTRESLDICDNWARILNLDLDPYLTIMGQDDMLYPGYLAEILQLIEAEPDASLFTTHFDLIDAQGNLRRSCHPVPLRESADEWLFNLHQFTRDSFGAGYVMRAADYRRLGGFSMFPTLLFADNMTTYRFSRLAYKACAPQHAFAFRIHDQSASHQVGIAEAYQAAKRYFNALAQAGHFDHPARRTAAIHYVSFTYNYHYHRVLADLIGSGDADQLRQYQRVKAAILADHAQAPLFEVFDIPSKIYETLAYVRPQFLRQAAYQVVKLVRWYRKRTVQRRLAALSRQCRLTDRSTPHTPCIETDQLS